MISKYIQIMKNTVAQFIPIILIVSLLSCSGEFVEFSHTRLGKIVGIALILFYTHLDKYIGLVFCLIVVIYYQSDFVENMLNTDDIMNKMFENFEQQKKEEKETSDSVSKIQPVKQKQNALAETMSNITDVYPGTNTYSSVKETMKNNDDSSKKEGMTLLDEFRKENCNGNQLMYKNMKVNPDMIGHVYPNLECKNGKCNVCDSTCECSIIENRLKNEKELFSKFSRDMENTDTKPHNA
jgi:hypothetical protein